MRGRQPLGPGPCGFDRAGRQIQHAKSSGPFEMSRQEARPEKRKAFPSHQCPGLPGSPCTASLLSAAWRHILMEVKGVPCPSPRAAGVGQVDKHTINQQSLGKSGPA